MLLQEDNIWPVTGLTAITSFARGTGSGRGRVRCIYIIMFDACACTTVKKVSRVLGRVYDANFSEAGINNTQFSVLRCISRHSGEPLARIAEEMEMDRTSLYRAITPMIREGWLVPGESANSRFRTARVTKKGRRLLAEATKRWDQMQRQIVGRFGRRAYESLLSELYRLTESAGGAE